MMKIGPRDQWGVIPAITGAGWSVVWSWPRGSMAWFLWNERGMYRIGPLTLHIWPDHYGA